MPITKAKGSQPDCSPALRATLKDALQKFLDVAARAGMKLPLTVAIFDRDGTGELVREFTVEDNNQISIGQSGDEQGRFQLPFVVVAVDANKRVSLSRIDPRETDAVAPDAKVVN